MTPDELLLKIYAIVKDEPLHVCGIDEVKKMAGDDFSQLWRRLTTDGYLDDRFAVGQTRLTDRGMTRAEDLSG
jgi:hypothetical protein